MLMGIRWKSNVQTYVCDVLDFIKKSTQMTRRKCAQLWVFLAAGITNDFVSFLLFFHILQIL